MVSFLLAFFSICAAEGWVEALKTGSHRNKFRIFSEYMTIVEQMLERHPNYLRKEEIGSSVEGRPLFVLHLVDQKSNLPKDQVLFTSTIHPREAMAPLSNLDFVAGTLEAVARGDAEALYRIQRRHTVVLPFVNPDGYVANEKSVTMFVRKNRAAVCQNGTQLWGWGQGVDLNRNFPMYGQTPSNDTKLPCSSTYAGEQPFDQPETAAIRSLVKKQNFTVSLHIHAYGRMLIIPTAAVGAQRKFFDECKEPSGAKIYGTAMETIGYRIPGGIVEWAFRDARIYAMGLEIGDTFWEPHSAKEKLLIGTRKFLKYLSHKAGCQPRIDVSGGKLTMENDGAAKCQTMRIATGNASTPTIIQVGDIEPRQATEVPNFQGTSGSKYCIQEIGLSVCLCNPTTIGGGEWVTQSEPLCAALLVKTVPSEGRLLSSLAIDANMAPAELCPDKDNADAPLEFMAL